MNIYHELLYRPILNALVFFYDTFGDIGLAVMAITIVIRIILYPSFHSSLKSQKSLQELQPKMEEVKNKYKDDKQKQMEAIMELYKEHKVNPLSSCLPLLVQLPVILALFQVLNDQLHKQTVEGLYSFVQNPGIIDPVAFGIVNLSSVNMVLAAIAAGLQFYQTKLLQPKKTGAADPAVNMMQKQMLYALPLVTFVVALTLPSGLPLYWATSTLFAIAQQLFIIRQRKES